MRKIISLFALMVLLVSVSGCAKARESQYELGTRYLSEGNYADAVDAFTAAIEADPKDASAYIGRGGAKTALRAAGGGWELLSQAVDDLSQAVAIDPSAVEPYRMLSEIYLKLDDAGKAISILREGFEATGDPALRTAAEEISAENPDAAHTPEPAGVSAEPVVVSFERMDHSLLDPDGSVSINLYYDLPVVEGDTPEIGKINGAFQKLYNDYSEQLAADNWMTDLAKNKPFPDEYFYTYSAEVTYNKANVLSVMHTMGWYMGGVFNNGYTGEVFDVRTGERLCLRELFPRDDDSLLSMLKDKITVFVTAIEPLDDHEAETIAGYTLDSLDFYIAEDGELIICIPVYELACGAAGALQIPCGLYYDAG